MEITTILLSMYVGIKAVGTAVVPGVARSVYGWFKNAMVDKKITKFEKKLLVETILRTGLYGILGYAGFTVAGVDNAEFSAMITAIVCDIVIRAIKKK